MKKARKYLRLFLTVSVPAIVLALVVAECLVRSHGSVRTWREINGLSAANKGASAAAAVVVAFVVAKASGALAALIEESITPAVMEQVEKVRRPPLYSPV